jgi:copper homeostasis protein
MPKRPIFEVCVDTPAGLAAAVAGGADRIELCAALSAHGVTPSPGFMALAAESGRPTYALIRPRAGDYVYSPADIDLMRREIDATRDAGLAGVAIGGNRRSGELDEDLIEVLVAQADGLGLTLHRCFDLVPDFAAALETAVAFGFERILTSGGAPTAMAGADRIAELVDLAAGRIALMAGSGVTPANVVELLARTHAPEVHGSCRAPTAVGSGGDHAQVARALGLVDGAPRDTDVAVVATIVRVLDGLA